MEEFKTLEYKGKVIPYKLVRTKIKNLYIYIKDGKVTVKIPYILSKKKQEEFINKKANWISKKLEEEKRKENKKEEKIEEKDIIKLQELVKKYVEKYSKILKVCPNKVRIKNIKYAWGSCSVNKNITINSKLAIKNEKIVEYVVLHEMCHLLEMNHSKKFWRLVEENIKDYKKLRKELNS